MSLVLSFVRTLPFPYYLSLPPPLGDAATDHELSGIAENWLQFSSAGGSVRKVKLAAPLLRGTKRRNVVPASCPRRQEHGAHGWQVNTPLREIFGRENSSSRDRSPLTWFRIGTTGRLERYIHVICKAASGQPEEFSSVLTSAQLRPVPSAYTAELRGTSRAARLSRMQIARKIKRRGRPARETSRRLIF